MKYSINLIYSLIRIVNKCAHFFGLKGINKFLIKKSKRFDLNFYNKTYPDVKINNIDPIDHYLAVGENQGNYPSKTFDPIIYKLKYSDLTHWKEPIFLHYILFGNKLGRTAKTTEINNKRLFKIEVKHEMLGYHNVQNEKDFLRSLNSKKKNFRLNSQITLKTPSVKFYIDLLKKRISFSFIKRSHAVWDAFVYLNYVYDYLEKKYRTTLNKEEILALSSRWMRMQPHQYGRFVFAFGENFIKELKSDLNSPPINEKNFFQGLSLLGHSGQIVPDIYSQHKIKMLEMIENHTNDLSNIYDATIWKKAGFTGELVYVLDAIKDRPVIVVGPSHLKDFNKRVELNNFHHVSIPRRGKAINARLKIYQDLLKVIKNLYLMDKNNNPIVIFQVGMVSYWLIYRLIRIYKDVTFLDLGLSIDLWYPEIITKPTAADTWMHHRRYILLKNMGLEKLYRKILGSKFYDYFPDLK